MADIEKEMLFFVIFFVNIVCSKGLVEVTEEPKCNSKFDYDYKLLHLVVNLEKKLDIVASTTERLKTQVDDIQARSYQYTAGQMSTLSEKVDGETLKIKDMEGKLHNIENQIQDLVKGIASIPRWNQWTEWSNCKLNCTAPNGGRFQTRSRKATASTQSGSKTEQETQSESRPCNAVQYAGCVKGSGSDDDEYAIVYDYPDMLAQATCTALGNGHIRAIRRNCSGPQTCLDVCTAVGTQCINALHVYSGEPVPKRGESGLKALKMYKYNTCSGVFCGPNFCCCEGD